MVLSSYFYSIIGTGFIVISDPTAKLREIKHQIALKPGNFYFASQSSTHFLILFCSIYVATGLVSGLMVNGVPSLSLTVQSGEVLEDIIVSSADKYGNTTPIAGMKISPTTTLTKDEPTRVTSPFVSGLDEQDYSLNKGVIIFHQLEVKADAGK